MRQKTRAVAGNLAALKAEMAHRFEGSEVVTVPAAVLRRGDRVLVRPGDRVPADGVVINGTSEIDESLVTGETARRAIAAGATVYAGSVNFSGALTLKVTAAGDATLIDEIERLLERAVEAKSRYRPSRRPRGTPLRAGRPYRGGTDRGRMAGGRGLAARFRRHCAFLCSSSPVHARWRWPFLRFRLSRPARCSAPA